MTKNDIISKVQKLFRLGESPNEHEAALATAKARSLLAAHNLSMSDLPAADLEKEMEATEHAISVARSVPSWEQTLFVEVAEQFNCFHIKRTRRGNVWFVCIGAKTDIEVALYTFSYLKHEIQRLARRDMPGLKAQNPYTSPAALRRSYCAGAVYRISTEAAKQAEHATDVEHACTALVEVKDRSIKKYIAEHCPTLRQVRARTIRVDADAFNIGYASAGNLNTRPGITGGQNQIAAGGVC